MAPLIGITGRRLRADRLVGLDSRFRAALIDVFYAEYALSVAAAGGVVVGLAFGDALAALPRLDGLIVTGGQDITPSAWGGPSSADRRGDPRQSFSAYDHERDQMELDLVRHAMQEHIAVLGVCRGAQVINTALGGTLHSHLGDEGAQSHDNDATVPDNGPNWHTVHFAAGSRCAAIYGSSTVTNSWHHHAVAEPGHGVVVTGRSADGVAEAIEIDGAAIIGVQWHPEWVQEPDPIFRWLVEAAADHERLISPLAAGPE